MTNFEWLLKEREELVKTCIVGNFAVDRRGNINVCRLMHCEDCIFSKLGIACTSVSREWLNAEHNPYTIPQDTPIDAKVLVTDIESGPWYKRHFAGFSEDKEQPYLAFKEGKTSWTHGLDDPVAWRYCKLAEGV